MPRNYDYRTVTFQRLYVVDINVYRRSEFLQTCVFKYKSIKMMAGSGVSVGGAGMLRTRRRDVSVKPNRKLDRKSSRGMIYENEELRLRTIHINAEVEQGQNDIKKLRRENEQLRREIWSLRDEYDKLEEILKRQKSRGESEEYEDRSDEDDGLQSDYSLEEDEEFAEDQDTQDTSKKTDKSEQLENAENQKISSEKMNSSLHRLHVDFDDLSVVDEEEELKKDKERTLSEDSQQSKEEKSLLSILKPRHLHENIPFYPGSYEPSPFGSSSYYTDCPFKYPSTVNLMMASDATGMIASHCPRLHADPLLPVPNLSSTNVDQVNEQILHAPPAGWQTNITMPQEHIMPFRATEVSVPLEMQTFGGIHQEQLEQQQFAPSTNGYSNFPTLLQRRISLKQSGSLLSATSFGNSQPSSENAMVQNGWGLEVDSSNTQGVKSQVSNDLKSDAEDKSKQFFAPLPSRLKKQSEESPLIITQFGTATSSSSGRTESTVISKNQFMFQKGSADIYVNGAIPYEDSLQKVIPEQRTFRSTENLLINNENINSSNQFTKSMSCQDLTSESQNISINQAEGRKQMLTQSDNTLDNISDSKPFKSHLSVTLKRPPPKQTCSPSTPKVPKLPSIDYRIFKNPFLRTFDPTYNYINQNNITSPLSVQVNDDNLCYYSTQPDVPCHRGVNLGDRYRPVQSDHNRLLIPSNQLINGKLMPSTSKHEIQVTSFEKPSPHTLIGPSNPFEFSTLRRLNTNPYLQSQNPYQNMPFVPRGGLYSQRGMMYYDNLTLKVPVQTQTSIDGDSHQEEEHTLSQEESIPNTPSGQRRKKTIRKEKGNLSKDHKPLSPAAQRRLKKQASVTSSEAPESPGKATQKRPRRLSITTTTTSEGQEDKPESRSSSSGQDSPKKDQIRRVSLYFNAKKRPSLASVKTVRSTSIDTAKEKDAVTSSERERTNSMSSREISGIKARKTSTSSGNVPWCACWGNGCI